MLQILFHRHLTAVKDRWVRQAKKYHSDHDARISGRYGAFLIVKQFIAGAVEIAKHPFFKSF